MRSEKATRDTSDETAALKFILEASMKHSLICCVAVALFCAVPVFAQCPFPKSRTTPRPNFLKMPNDIYLGEVLGVATNSKGQYLFIPGRVR